ncbi:MULTISPECIES: serine hydrolase domain-containing protein [unclassified Sphingopyxis]|uniref:serine hydrolase domain-containing protein n=1 Tax=unclassified Sphingopyxis TaxID=2614943 RepID=UPI000736F03B|nr:MULTISPECIES: serine hydrolase domain-containing protein [unclassified Sphingopyxis]KTE32384.1 serine hydrolase [Sphingopyxis sp. HIX]KTE71713.1 serine hydrolase [Sphingopyxis sp. HXXIV]
MRRAKLALALPLLMAANAEAKPVADPAVVAKIAKQAMTATGARGLAIAVIDKGKVVSVQSFGERNAKGEPLTPQTIMYGASLTKAVFAYTVLRLADEGKVDLDKPIAALLEKPLPEYGNLDAYGNWGDLAGDERWRTVTPRHVLNHSTGFANFHFLEPDQKLRFHFDPGSRYGYSGEGIMLLQFGLDKGLGLDTGQQVQRLVFDPLKMSNSSLVWRPDFAANYADGWTLDGGVEAHDERGRVRMAGSMDTTITDLANFAAALVSGEGLSKKARGELLRPGLPIRSAGQFPTLAGDVPAAQQHKGLAASVGLITYTGPQGPAFFRGGHNDSTGNTLVCVEKGQRCVLIMSNDVRAEAAFPMIVRDILGDTGTPWRWIFGDMKFV